MIQRVNGSLAVSRALGDFEYKNVEGKGPTEQLVSPEPEFFVKVNMFQYASFCAVTGKVIGSTFHQLVALLHWNIEKLDSDF